MNEKLRNYEAELKRKKDETLNELEESSSKFIEYWKGLSGVFIFPQHQFNGCPFLVNVQQIPYPVSFTD
ncbi:hypothetical protein CR513_09224, partial [Mucuna pruriens]